MVKALVFLATGFEEIEASTTVDILRRCGVEVTIAGLMPGLIEGAHGIKFESDVPIEKVEAKDFEAIICPGGAPGFENLRKSQKVLEIVRSAFRAKKLIAAICAAPAVLADAGVLRGKKCTIYPGMERELEKGGGTPEVDVVVVDGTIVTSRGPATALPFALKLAEKLVGEKVAEKVAKETLADIGLR